MRSGNYTLQLALASASLCELQVCNSIHSRVRPISSNYLEQFNVFSRCKSIFLRRYFRKTCTRGTIPGTVRDDYQRGSASFSLNSLLSLMNKIGHSQIFLMNFLFVNHFFFLVKVRVNNPQAAHPHFTTRLIGRDNAIARHGIHGLYSLYSVDISSFQLVKGSNSIYLTQSRGGSPFNGLMYDYLRLEGPPYAS